MGIIPVLLGCRKVDGPVYIGDPHAVAARGELDPRKAGTGHGENKELLDGLVPVPLYLLAEIPAGEVLLRREGIPGAQQNGLVPYVDRRVPAQFTDHPFELRSIDPAQQVPQGILRWTSPGIGFEYKEIR